MVPRNSKVKYHQDNIIGHISINEFNTIANLAPLIYLNPRPSNCTLHSMDIGSSFYIIITMTSFSL